MRSSGGMEGDRQRWLKTIEAACETVLARDSGDPGDPPYAALLQDVTELLARVRAELAAA